MIQTGGCVEVMAGMDAASVDAIVTDPPYGLEFMGKQWDRLDSGLPQENVWKGRRGKGGSSISEDKATRASRHGVALGGGKSAFKRCRTCGKRAFSGSPCQCADPQWVIEYPDGAPSSVIRMGRWHERWATEAFRVAKPGAYLLAFGGTRTYHRMTCAIEDAGWIIRDCLVWAYASGFPKSRALLKPAWEPIVMARKPGPLRELAIDACRIGTTVETWPASRRYGGGPAPIGARGFDGGETQATGDAPLGRWPANLILTDPIFDGDTPGVVGGGEAPGAVSFSRSGTGWYDPGEQSLQAGYGDTGTYSRFFLVPKSDRSEREPITRGGAQSGTRFNTHPT